MSYVRLAIRLFTALTVEDAREILGFPPGYTPSQAELTKAWKAKSFENHPDRGGDPSKMVEINVAKDILEGKRRPDNTPRAEESAEDKRKAELKKDRETIQAQKFSAEELFQTATAEIVHATAPGWRLDLKDFLVDDFAHIVSDLYDDAEEEAEDADGEKAVQDTWKKVLEACRNLSTLGLLLASRFNTLKKLHSDALRGSSVKELRNLEAATKKFMTEFKKLKAASDKLVTTMNASEVVPLHSADAYWKAHDVISVFHDGFEKTNLSVVDKLENDMAKKVKVVMGVLKKYDLDSQFSSNSDEWEVPATFAIALNALSHAKKAASVADRVATRFQKQTGRE